MKVERLRLVDSLMTGICITQPGHGRRAQAKISIHLIGRSKKNEWLISRFTGCINNVKRAAKVYFEIMAWINNRGGHRYLGGEIIDLGCRGNGFFNQPGVAYVTNGYLQPAGIACRLFKPFQVMAHSRAPEIVKDVYSCFCPGQQVVGQVRSDKTGATEDQYRAAFLRHHYSCFLAFMLSGPDC